MSDDSRFYLRVIAGIVAGLVGLLIIIFAIVGGAKEFGRYQGRKDAHNRVKVSAIEIQNQAQRVEIAKQKAEIRYQDAVGVKEAQDEIAKTLTPLYVQYEMVTAMQAIAQSGQNNTVVFIPVGANGIPLISSTGDVVGLPK